MSILFQPRPTVLDEADTLAKYQHLRVFVANSSAMILHRMLLLALGLLIQWIYLGLEVAAISLTLLLIGECFDARTLVLARAVQGDDDRRIGVMRRINLGAVYGAAVGGFLALSVVVAPTGLPIVVPALFLLAMCIFAHRQSRPFTTALIIRLTVNGGCLFALALLFAAKSQSLDAVVVFITCAVALLIVAASARDRVLRDNQLSQVRHEKDRALAALEARTEFLCTVSHELRTPLTSLRASLDMTLAGAFGPLPPKPAHVLTIAQRNAAKLSALIDELLDLQKMEVGMMKFDFCEVNLARLVAQTVADNRAFAQDLDVKLKLMPVDSDVFVRADPMRLEQALTNLLSNAVKFSEPGSEVTIEVVASREVVRIEVADHGIGINLADHADIFECFSQLDTTIVRKVNGTGLGLNISKRIIEAHDGVIGLEPNSGGGTVFFLQLARHVESTQKPQSSKAA
jgi:signal transduction histidine kinase